MRIRITFTKLGAARYTSHLDLHRTWERTLRRAGLPLAYSQGFNPQPRIQLAAALPLGFTSQGEVMDLWVDGEVDLEAALVELHRAVPPGIEVLAVQAVEERLPALQTQVRSADYTVTVESVLSEAALDGRIEALLSAETLPRERRGKPYDLRPLIESLAREETTGSIHRLGMRLAARNGATGRPEEVLAALELDNAVASINRLKLYFAEGN